jgi:hypothetical protein
MSLIERLNALDGMEPDEIVRSLQKRNMFQELYSGQSIARLWVDNEVLSAQMARNLVRTMYADTFGTPTGRYVRGREPRPDSAFHTRVIDHRWTRVPRPEPED